MNRPTLARSLLVLLLLSQALGGGCDAAGEGATDAARSGDGAGLSGGGDVWIPAADSAGSADGLDPSGGGSLEDARTPPGGGPDARAPGGDGLLRPPENCEPPCEAEACEVCVPDGVGWVCASACDPLACEECVAGSCVSACDGQCMCVDGSCMDTPCGDGCLDPNEWGYCDASVVAALSVAPPGSPEPPPPCCCDLTGDGVTDNALAEMLRQLGPMIGTDEGAVDALLAAAIASGDLRLLLEYVGMAAFGEDSPYFDLNAYLGAEADGDPTNDFDGTGEYLIRPESLWDDEPLVVFEGAAVEGGVLTAGPSQLVIPFALPDPPFEGAVTLDAVMLRGTLYLGPAGYSIDDGTLCGVLVAEQLAGVVNEFAAQYCDCLGVTGDLITAVEGALECADTVPGCEPTDRAQELCGYLGQYCHTALLVLPEFFDVDLGDDGREDALSVGATFRAVAATIVGVQGEPR